MTMSYPCQFLTILFYPCQVTHCPFTLVRSCTVLSPMSGHALGFRPCQVMHWGFRPCQVTHGPLTFFRSHTVLLLSSDHALFYSCQVMRCRFTLVGFHTVLSLLSVHTLSFHSCQFTHCLFTLVRSHTVLSILSGHALSFQSCQVTQGTFTSVGSRLPVNFKVDYNSSLSFSVAFRCLFRSSVLSVYHSCCSLMSSDGKFSHFQQQM